MIDEIINQFDAVTSRFMYVEQFQEKSATLEETKAIALDFNNSKIDEPKQWLEIGQSLQKCLSLEFLDLTANYNNLRDEDSISNIISSLSTLKNLQYLNLSLFDCQINQQGAATLGQELSKLQTLKFLQIIMNNNQIGLEGATSLCEGISQLKNLEQLSLIFIWTGDKYGNQSSVLFKHISNCKNLRRFAIYLQSQNISDEGAVEISSIISSNLKQLEHLHLQLAYNKIEGKGIAALGESISKCTNLKSLIFEVQENKYDSHSFSQFMNSISKCSELTSLELQLDENPLKDEDACSLGKTISQFVNIKKVIVQLCHSQFKDAGAVKFVKHLSNCKALEYFQLSLGNTVQSEGVGQIGNEISNYQSLKTLKLYVQDTSADAAAFSYCYQKIKSLNIENFTFSPRQDD